MNNPFEKITTINEPLVFNSDGSELIHTNYFETQMCKDGVIFLSWNAGSARLLLPEQHHSILAEAMNQNVSHVLMRKVTLPTGADGIEMVFDDGSVCPYTVTITVDATDRLLTGIGLESFMFAIYSKAGKEYQLTAIYSGL